MDGLLQKVKANLILEHDQDDDLLKDYISAAVNYAENFQHIKPGTYAKKDMAPATQQGVIMLASHFYESRDGSTAGFYADNVGASKQVWETVDRLLRLNRNWKV